MPARTRSWAKLKKTELAALAEREIHGTGWLPQPLRSIGDDRADRRITACPPKRLPEVSSGRDRPHRVSPVVRPVSFPPPLAGCSSSAFY